MRVLISGASGLIGSALASFLEGKGVEVSALRRGKTGAANTGRDVGWNPREGGAAPEDFEGFDAVVHLAGENIADGRWTPEKKRRIYASRVEDTTLLARTLAACTAPPQTFLCASAVGFYGDRGDELLDESSSPGQGFLADTCRDWEAAARPVADAGVRVIHLRTGMVLSAQGGALPRMLTPFRLGLGGPIGRGRAWMSWIALSDMIRVIHHGLCDTGLSGPVNAVAPHPVRNRDFTRALARALGRPALLPVPPIVLKLAFGDMARELLLSSTRATPGRLESAAFRWDLPEIGQALGHCLGNEA